MRTRSQLIRNTVLLIAALVLLLLSLAVLIVVSVLSAWNVRTLGP